jgi:hypothetical protein
MKAVTVRNLPPELVKAIHKKAEENGVSINKAVIALLQEGTGIPKQKGKKPIHHDLDALAGSWTKEDAREFDKALKAQRGIDLDLWR